MAGLIQLFNSQFDVIDRRSLDLLARLNESRLFWKPPRVEAEGEPYSCGELVIRSAGAIEQTFGGITTRLWDDPFEWALPEELSTKSRVTEYLKDVTATRRTGFEFLTSDDDLFKQIPAPENLRSIAEILLDTVGRSSNLQGRAFGVAQQFLRLRPHIS